MGDEREGAVWIASYPKSGNTWIRCLLEAYRRGGVLDINDMRITTSDGGATIVQGVSPVPLGILGFRGEMMLRPAALLNLFSRLTKPIWVKTHFANFQPDGLPHCIPPDFTERAVYVVRDPRSVVTSFAKFYGFSMHTACDAMASKDFTVGGGENYSRCLLSSWSNHAASWASEKVFPVHVVRYEDLTENTEKELTEVLEFLGIEVNEALVKKAVSAAKISRLQKIEQDKGFRENAGKGGSFFNNGGIHWKEDLGPTWIKRIEKDHGKVMKALGYLDG